MPELNLHFLWNCPACGTQHGELTDHPVADRLCGSCILGITMRRPKVQIPARATLSISCPKHGSVQVPAGESECPDCVAAENAALNEERHEREDIENEKPTAIIERMEAVDRIMKEMPCPEPNPSMTSPPESPETTTEKSSSS